MQVSAGSRLDPENSFGLQALEKGRIRDINFQLQKSLTPDFEEKRGNSPDISKGISQLGMCKFESSRPSQAVPCAEL
jgi:hypothetical protein